MIVRHAVHPDPEREDLMRTGSCFNCKKPEHLAAECPLKTIHELDNVSENDLPLPKTWLGGSNLISASSCLPNDACAPKPLVVDCILSSMSKKIPLKVFSHRRYRLWVYRRTLRAERIETATTDHRDPEKTLPNTGSTKKVGTTGIHL
jgi:hypothetical protein